MKEIIRYIKKNQKRFIEDLKACVRIPSVSSQSRRRKDMVRCAQHLKKEFLRIGFQRVSVNPTKKHPVVLAQWKHPDPGKPAALIYGHYDVQPEEPLPLWKTPPFKPTVRGRQLYGRGVVDDKGQVYVHLKALEAHLKAAGKLPLNVTFLIEGEEEIGSHSLEKYLLANRRRLKADHLIVSDTSMLKKEAPSIVYGLRGIVYMEVEVSGPSQDLHSGCWGGGVPNPVNVLAEMIARLKDKNGRVLIPGFYDDVKPLTARERQSLRCLPVKESHYRQLSGVPCLEGEKGFSFHERIWCRPTLDVNGIFGGYTGEGSKTIIPSKASAKISTRLVPGQNHKKIARLFTKYIYKIAPKTVRVKVSCHHSGEPFYADTAHPIFDAARHALKKGFGKNPVFIREGGSIPFVNTLARVFKKPVLLVGFGLPGDNIHGPNEKLDLDIYRKGILSCAHLYDELARLN